MGINIKTPGVHHVTLRVAEGWLPRYSALIPSLGLSSLAAHRVDGPGWSLVGDAAGTVDPLTREGIRHSLDSADLLADAFESGSPGDYGSLWRKRFLPEFTWAASRRERFYAPDLTSRLVRYLGGSRSIRRVMADLITGKQDYSTLKRRLLRAAFPAGLELGVKRTRTLLSSSFSPPAPQ